LHCDGLIGSDFWNIWHDGIETAVSKPAFQQAWQAMQDNTNYGADFSKFIDKLMQSRETAAPS
jgi:hypothetical protein